MIWKLSLTGIKSRLKDYLVLFSGLTVASMVFYMFLAIAVNPAFIKNDIHVRTDYLKYIFIFGIVLLVIITLVYLLYADTFLLSMRKHDYGMYMMLGAKSTRIGRLIFGETLITGLLATFLGLILGFGLTWISLKILISKLGLEIPHFQAILPNAIIITIAFFLVIFLVVALANVYKLTHTPVITLLHEDQAPVKFRYRPFLRVIEAAGGVFLLAIGYYVMTLPKEQVFKIIPTALVTIVIGSYLIFAAVFSSLVGLLLKRKSFSYHGIRMFTLGQLKFRLQSYTRVLTMISLLFALALGAITVGLNFDSLNDLATQSVYYDATIVSNSSAVKKAESKLDVISKQTYHYKETKKVLYFDQAELSKQPVKYVSVNYSNNRGVTQYTIKALQVNKISDSNAIDNTIFMRMVPNHGQQKVKLVSSKELSKLSGQKNFVSLLRVKDFRQAYPIIAKIESQQVKEKPAFSALVPQSKAAFYGNSLAYSSSFEFMGFFLGFAFLTMLASTLMFKVLSGAAGDKAKYRMLYQMGTRKQLLRRSIKAEIGVLFLLPALLGVIDVLFGLQLFKDLLENPYRSIWIPFAIFIILYSFYYLLTVKLYEKLVLTKE